MFNSYKNIFQKLRASYKLVARAQYNAAHAVAAVPAAASGVLPTEERFPELLDDYKLYSEQQIQALCTEITQLMENSVVKTTTKVESKVFFSKLCGDYYRYCSEVLHDRQIRVNYEKKWYVTHHSGPTVRYSCTCTSWR